MRTGRSQSPGLRIPRHSPAALAVMLLTGACTPAYNAPPVSPQLAGVARQPASLLERGYVAHQAKCAKCHPFEDPAKYGETELREEIMPVMARKAKLDHADQEAVLAYLLAARKLPP